MTTATRPNILAIFSDQLRRNALSAFGDPNIETPHIDSLVQSGVSFRNACSTYPICVPFRFSLMTGEYAHSRFVPGIEWRMSPAERTLADEFNDASYETIYLGKWHLYGGHALLPGHSTLKANRTPVPRQHQGRWERWFGFELRNGHFDTYYTVNDDPVLRPIETYQTDGLFNLMMDYLRDGRDRERPFCCVVSVEPPHFPYEAPEELETKWLNQELILPPSFSAKDEGERAAFIKRRQLYYAMVENLDMNVGRLLTYLDDTGQRENTIIVFFSDHGEMGGCHGLPTQAKQYPYEESIGIPLIVVDPNNTAQAGKILDAPTCTEDLFPTLLGLANLTPQTPKPGFDLAPLIRGQVDMLPREGVLLEFVAEFRVNAQFHEQMWRGFRSERYKYTVIGDVYGGEPWQFFDLQDDPDEMNNLLENVRYTNEIRRHHQLLREQVIATEDHYVLKPAFGFEGINLWET